MIEIKEPLLNEKEAAKFLGVSRITLLRKRKLGEVAFFRIGFRVLYSKEKHLLPFLEKCEQLAPAVN
ncbi:MAG: helix-turn-helix domain-containing protein [Acidobacteriota bacterium]|nr:helix-turn-helix domain-containing protein [Acidobacteriota bacterium]